MHPIHTHRLAALHRQCGIAAFRRVHHLLDDAFAIKCGVGRNARHPTRRVMPRTLREARAFVDGMLRP